MLSGALDEDIAMPVKDDAEFIANEIDAMASAGVAADGDWHTEATDAPQVAGTKERSDS